MININDHENLKVWPFVEAKKIIKNLGGINNFKAQEKGYVLFETNPGEDLDLIILSTGSEVSLVKDAVMSFIESNKSVNIRVVSMPCIELFLSQSEDYRNSVLPKGIKKLAVEAGSSVNWYRFIGDNGAVMGIDSFGESAPAHHVFEHFGITLAGVKAKIADLV